MALDGIVLSKLVKHLNDETPIRINKIYSIGKNELLFNVRSNKQSKRLIISGDANQNRIHFTERNYPNDSEPSNFVMLLRKHLTNGMIVNIHQYNYDRILRLEIVNHNSIGDQVTFFMYLELMGRYANIILTDKDNIIFDAIKRISPLENPNQVIVPGAKYEIYADMEKLSLFETKNFDINESLVKQFSGVSPTLEKEIRYRLEHDESFNEIIDEINESDQLILSSKDKSNDFHVIPLTHHYDDFNEASFSDGFDLFFYEKSQHERIKQVTNDLLRFLRKESKKLNKKLIKIENEIENNTNSEINLKYGDLITTYQYQITKGDTKAILNDYDTLEDVHIDLDPKLSPIDNAQKYYKLYKKQSKSLDHLNEQIKIANEELSYFNLLTEQLDYSDVNSAKEIRQELVDKKYIFEKKKHQKRKSNKPHYLTIQLEDAIIKVGKNNIQNDYILKNSNRNDYWFHVQTYHGSHVVVNTQNLRDELIVLAATLAAHFSQAKDAKNVTVDYTQVRNVKRTGSKGLVLLKEFDSVVVENDKSVIKNYL